MLKPFQTRKLLRFALIFVTTMQLFRPIQVESIQSPQFREFLHELSGIVLKTEITQILWFQSELSGAVSVEVISCFHALQRRWPTLSYLYVRTLFRAIIVQAWNGCCWSGVSNISWFSQLRGLTTTAILFNQENGARVLYSDFFLLLVHFLENFSRWPRECPSNAKDFQGISTISCSE